MPYAEYGSLAEIQDISRRSDCGTRSSGPIALHLLQAGVAAEEFVAAIAAERHLDGARGELADDEGGDGGRIGERLAEVFDEFLDDADGIGPHDDFMMVGRVLFGHHPGVGKFVEAALFEADGKRLDGLRRLERHGCHHRTGIDAAAQEGAERNVGDHADAYGFVELLADADDGLGMSEAGRGFGGRRRHLPVAALLHRAALVGEPAARREPGGWRDRRSADPECN